MTKQNKTKTPPTLTFAHMQFQGPEAARDTAREDGSPPLWSARVTTTY